MNAPSSTTGTPPSGFFGKIKALITSGGGYWSTLILVIVLTIGIFMGIFYLYSPSEVIPLALSSTLASLGLILLGVLFSFSANKSLISNTFTRFAFSLYFFMPYALFTFGIISDAVNARLQYFPAGLAGLTGVLFNYALSLMSTGGKIPPVQNALCEIPGLSMISSTLAPQSMMFTLSALAYIATYVNRSNIGGTNGFVLDINYRWPSWVLFVSVAVLHILVLRAAGCLNDPKRIAWGIFLPLLWGGLLGFAAFSTLERTDSKFNSGPGAGAGAGAGAGTSGVNEKSTTIETATCSASGPDGEMTCDV